MRGLKTYRSEKTNIDGNIIYIIDILSIRTIRSYRGGNDDD